MAGDSDIEEMEKDLEALFESHPVAAARESGVHTTEEGKATSATDALLQKILVGDEPVKVDVRKLLSATWRMEADDLRTVVTTAIMSRLQTLERFDKLRRAYDENQELLAKSQEELAECKAKYIALEKVVHANNSTLTMSMSSPSSTVWTPAKMTLESPAVEAPSGRRWQARPRTRKRTRMRHSRISAVEGRLWHLGTRRSSTATSRAVRRHRRSWRS